MKKRNMQMVVALGVILLFATGCANPQQTLAPPNADSNASRVITKSSDPRGGDVDGSNTNFEASIQLSYYDSRSTAIDRSGLSDIRVARDMTNLRRIRVEAPQISDGQSICVITGAQYDADVCGYGSYFTDIGEERCGVPQSGSITFDLARSDYNVVTVIYRDDLTQFENWISGVANELAYPALAQDQIDTNLPSPGCNF